MIGFYDYTVILTYLSLGCSVIGMFLATEGHLRWALMCLALSGLLDGFDGKVARTKKNRTEDQKNFGIQIDSLCDIVCFGVFPVIICWNSGMNNAFSDLILVFYCLAGLIRLAFFNVMEGKKKAPVLGKRKYYQGMPITSIAVILPCLFAVSSLFEHNFMIVLNIGMLVTGLLFILNFKFPKPTNREFTVLVVFGVLVTLYLIYRFNWKEYVNWNLKDFLTEKLTFLSGLLKKK